MTLERIPAELRALNRWVVWRWGEVDPKTGKRKKPPYCPSDPGRHASSTNSETWGTFEQAVSLVAAGHADGLGVALKPPYVGVDLDDELSENERYAIMLALDSYAEVSVSGAGHHVILKAHLNGRGRHPQGIGVFQEDRLWYCSGEHVTGTPETIEERQVELEELLAEYLPPQQESGPVLPAQPVNVDDSDLVEAGMQLLPKFGALWGGGWNEYPSQSEADLALCNYLAWLTGRDTSRMDRMFRSSGLYRDKWERDDYREGRLELAITGCRDVYEPPEVVAPDPLVQKRTKGSEGPAGASSRKVSSLASLSSQSWPDPLGETAYHGLTGDFVRLVEPHTEADPAAVLVQFLIAAANMVGRGTHFTAGSRRHYTNLNAVVVGKTAKGRKGTSFAPTVSVLGAVDPDWESERRQSGLSSGEGLIHAVRDAIVKTEKGEETIVDEGVSDKRLLVVEEEFASVLKVLQRDGNTLSTTLRQAFDDGRLRTLTRQAPIKATDAHFSILGHITLEELRRELTATDAMSGLANRFVWVLARRSKLLPDGGEFHRVDVAPLVRQLNEAASFARKRGITECERDREARELWHAVYPELTRDVPGLLGAAIARAEAITMRLALVYAVLDCSPRIRREHLEAGLEVWRYCRDSAGVIFGARTGDDYADRIEAEVVRKGRLTRTEVRDLFGRHAKVGRIESAIELLVELDRVESTEEATGGRPVQVLRPKRPKRPKR